VRWMTWRATSARLYSAVPATSAPVTDAMEGFDPEDPITFTLVAGEPIQIPASTITIIPGATFPEDPTDMQLLVPVGFGGMSESRIPLQSRLCTCGRVYRSRCFDVYTSSTAF
jgi:hypothetical protein